MDDEIVITGGIIITPLIKAKQAFAIALSAPKTDLNRDASIHRFEFTFELAWKAMKRVLRYKGLQANSPRDVIRDAASEGLILDPVLWFGFLENRNRTVHTYNEAIADEIYADLPSFNRALEQLLVKLQSL